MEATPAIPATATTTPALVSEPSSVIVRNIAPSVDPPTHKVLTEFFSFCGAITALSIARDDRDVTGNSSMAVITFENKAASRTAVLLNNALINERSIIVEIAPPGFSLSSSTSNPDSIIHTVPTHELPESSPSTSSNAIVNLLAKGYSLSADAAAKAREIDEEYSISKRASELASSAAEGIRNVDAKLGVSATLKGWGDSIQTKAVEVSEDLKLTEKGQLASQALGDFGRNVGLGLQNVATTTAEYVVETPVLRDATQTISGWGTAVADVFRDAKTKADQQAPPPPGTATPPVPQKIGTPQPQRPHQ